MAVRINSDFGQGQRRAAAAFHEALLAQRVPAELVAELASAYPRFGLRDVMGSVQLGHRNHRWGDDRY